MLPANLEQAALASRVAAFPSRFSPSRCYRTASTNPAQASLISANCPAIIAPPWKGLEGACWTLQGPGGWGAEASNILL